MKDIIRNNIEKFSRLNEHKYLKYKIKSLADTLEFEY